MAKRIRHVPANIKDRAPSSTSKRAPEKKSNMNLIDSEKKSRIPGDTILALQLCIGTPRYGADAKSQQWYEDDSLSLYFGLRPRDAAEAILAALTVAVTNASMDCLGRAGRCGGSLPARDLNLRHGLKAALAARDLISALDGRRGRNPNTVNVGKVNVGSGGQAIVGNVEAGGRRETSTSGRVRRVRLKTKTT